MRLSPAVQTTQTMAGQLRGINEMRVEGVERTGAFENSSHCLFVACEEEFYYCDSPSRRLGP
jgi:hypothetical protein